MAAIKITTKLVAYNNMNLLSSSSGGCKSENESQGVGRAVPFGEAPGKNLSFSCGVTLTLILLPPSFTYNNPCNYIG